jgi:two-component system heavy metal sensor histidine kinase CusS
MWARVARRRYGGDRGRLCDGAGKPHDAQLSLAHRRCGRAAILLTSVLGFLLLRRGLQPLEAMSQRAAQITPDRLSARLEQDGMPAELRRVALSFNAMLDRLEAGYDHLAQFSGDLAHEIRTHQRADGPEPGRPGQRRAPEEYEQLLESNVEELQRLARIVENILFLAQADHATLAVECSALDLHEELGKVTDYFEGIADERGLRFELQAQGICHANRDMWRPRGEQPGHQCRALWRG